MFGKTPISSCLGELTPTTDTNTELAIQRTVLANERTLLAWYRTAFGVLALAVGLGDVVPSLISTGAGRGKVYTIVGICFALLGVAATVEGILRYLRSYRQMPGQSGTDNREVVRGIAGGVIIAALGVVIAVTLFLDRFT